MCVNRAYSIKNLFSKNQILPSNLELKTQFSYFSFILEYADTKSLRMIKYPSE